MLSSTVFKNIVLIYLELGVNYIQRIFKSISPACAYDDVCPGQVISYTRKYIPEKRRQF